MTVQCDKVATNHDFEFPLCKTHSVEARHRERQASRELDAVEAMLAQPPSEQSNGDTVAVGLQPTKASASETGASEKTIPVRSQKRPLSSGQPRPSKRRKPSPLPEASHDDGVDSDEEGEEDEFQDALEDIDSSDDAEAETDTNEIPDSSHTNDRSTAQHPYSGQGDITQGLFEILDQQAKKSPCKTRIGRRIMLTCEELTRQTDPSSTVIKHCLSDVQELLKSTRSKKWDVEVQQNLKGDVFAKIFRALAQHLKLACESCNELQPASLQLMNQLRALSSFVNEILSFRDHLNSWNVPLPGKYKATGISKQVDSKFISRLRKFKSNLQIQMRQTEAEIQTQRERRELEEKNQEASLRRKRELADTSRKATWQLIRIERLSCEPDPFKRLRLTNADNKVLDMTTKLERDANGEEYERVAVFKQRSTPLSRQASGTEQQTWTEQQEIVLLRSLEGLLSNAPRSLPHEVFKYIFTRHCRPGKDLQAFGALEIAEKIAYLRQQYITQYEEHGWELPTWVQKIPVLP